MFYGAPDFIHKNARRLRNHSTKAENTLWQELKKHPLGYKFRRQHPISVFIADFYCHRAKLIIEVDGAIHDQESAKVKDMEREWNLELMGLTILRFRNDDVLDHLSLVMEKIKLKLSEDP
jgi:imidazole glycerol-phosphate synthase subunit HisF